MQSLSVKITQNLKIHNTTYKLHSLVNRDIHSPVIQGTRTNMFLHRIVKVEKDFKIT